MKLNKIFMLAGVAMMSFVMAACSDDDNDYTAGAPVASDCPGLSFVAEDNMKSVELDPTDPTSVDVKVTRSNTTGSGTYNVKVLSNPDNVFNVPATVTFDAGATEATVHVTFDNAEVGTTYTLQLGLEDSDVNPYKTTTVSAFAYSFVRVKWNSLGKGQWINTFLYGVFWDEVEIQQRDDKPQYYRVENLYTDDFVNSQEAIPAGYEPWLVFVLSKTGYVSWNGWFNINTIHPSYGAVVKAYLPSALDDSLAGDDASSKAHYDEDGNITYFELMPYMYMDGIGGWGLKPYYVAFPGYDLASELGI
ncbi:MAG: hypothetical protein ACI3Y0_09165 [Prevotella sp.]